MNDRNGFHLFDYLTFLVNRKELFAFIFLSSAVLIYGIVFLFVKEKYEATAVIIPRDEEVPGVVSSVLRSVRGLPFNLGGSSAGTETDIYETIIFSRSFLEEVVKRFDLLEEYDIDTTKIGYMEGAVKELSGEIKTKITPEAAFIVSVRATSREKSADMTNFVVSKMNDMIVDLKARRSRENRVFLEQRVAEISQQLRSAEDSLRAFQERTGLLDAKSQVEGILTAHTKLESELTAMQVQRGILHRVMADDSPQLRSIEIQIQEVERKLEDLREHGNPGSPLIGLKAIPQTAVEFLRRFREVEINGLVLEYVIPIYEQAKIEEKKDVPVLQVIDYAVPPAKRSFPPRTIIALIGAFSVTLTVFLALKGRQSFLSTADDRWRNLLKDASRWKLGPRKME